MYVPFLWAFVGLSGLLVGVAIETPVPPLVEGGSQGSQGTEFKGRVFVLLIESLRPALARDPERLPKLAALGQKSLIFDLDTVDPVVTPGPIVTAFSGRQQLQWLGSWRSLIEPGRIHSSLFSQMTEAGLVAVVYSDPWAFAPFAPHIKERWPRHQGSQHGRTGQRAQLRQAEERYARGDAHLLVFHLTFLDEIAHRYRSAHPEYQKALQEIDDIVGHLDRIVGPSDTLVIMGDHGHGDLGRHTPGLHVPTVFLARGPPFEPGTSLAPQPMMAVRYFLAKALGLAEVNSSRYPFRLSFLLCLIVAAGIGGLFLGYVRVLDWVDRRTTRSTFSEWSWERLFGTVSLALTAGFAVGWFTPAVVQRWPSLPDYVLNQVWASLLFLGLYLVGVRGWSPVRYGLAIFGIPFMILPPHALSLGAPSVFAPAWMVFTGLQLTRILGVSKTRKEGTAIVRSSLIAGLCLLALLQLFFHIESFDRLFLQFGPLVHELAPMSLYPRSFFVGVATFFVLRRPGSGVANVGLALLVSLLTVALQLRIVPEGHRTLFWCGLLLLFGGVGLESSRSGLTIHDGRPLWRVLSLEGATLRLAGGLALLGYTVRLGHEFRAHLIFVLAAVKLATRLETKTSQDVGERQLGVFLILSLAMVGMGWIVFGWGLDRIEWAFLYDAFPVDLVTRKMGDMLPLIVGRYALLMLLVRWLIAQAIPGSYDDVRALVFRALGLKCLVLLAMILGIAAVEPWGQSLVGALSQLVVMVILALGLA